MDQFPHAKWIFFDVGYTLLDETPAWEHVFGHVAGELEKLGRPTETKAIWQTFSQVCVDYEPKQWLAIARRLSTTPAEAELLAGLSRHWNHDLQVSHDRAVDVLKALSPRYRLGVIANQWQGVAERLKRYDLHEYFSLIIGSAEAGVVKPDPAIFRMALSQADCPAEEAVMIGDRIDNDVKPAKALGMGTVHVRHATSGRQVPRDASEVPTASVATLAAVPGLFGIDLE